MAQAPRTNAGHDQNWKPTLIGVSTTDGITAVPVEVDPTNGQMQVSSTGGGGGGAATIADGADVTQGAVADVAYSSGSGTVVSVLKGIFGKVADVATQTTLALIKAKTDNIDVALSTRTKPADQQHVLLDANSGIDIGKLTANQSVNQAQVVGTAIDVNSGNKSPGSQRMVIATDDVNISAIKTDADTQAGAVTSTRMAVNAISGQAGVAADVGATSATTQRVVQANGTGRTLVSIGGSVASSGNNTLVAAGTNKLKVYAFMLSTTSTTSTTCIFQSGASGTELWRVVLQAPTSVNVGGALAVTPPAFIFATAAATLLNLNLSGAQTIHWSVAYFDEA